MQNKLIVSFIWLSLLFTASASAELPDNNLFGKPEEGQYVTVEKLQTADTFVLTTGQRIRMIGMVAPEPPPHKRIERDEQGFIQEDLDPRYSFEDQAFEFVFNLIKGKKVRLEFDAQNKSEDERTLAYVFLEDGTFVNTEILRHGYANLRISPPNTKYADKLRDAYREARQEQRGLQAQ